MARDVSVTFIGPDGESIDEVVEARNTGMDIVLSSAEGTQKLVLSTAQMRELLDDRSDWPQSEAA